MLAAAGDPEPTPPESELHEADGGQDAESDEWKALDARARAAFDVHRWSAARELYLQALAAGAPEQEAWLASYRIGVCSLGIGEWEQGSAELLAAWQARPWRCEPLFHLGRGARTRGKNGPAVVAAARTLAIPPPGPEERFVDRYAAYDGPLEDLSIAAFYTDQRPLGWEACEALLHSSTAPAQARDLAIRNVVHYSRRLETVFTWPLPVPERLRASGESCSPGSLVPADNGYLLLARLHNYDPAARTYAGHATQWDFRARNALIRLDAGLQQVATNEIDDALHDRLCPHPLDRLLVRGIEEANLLRWGDDWWITGLSGHLSPLGRRGMLLARLDPTLTCIERVSPLVWERPDPRPRERRWLPFVHDNRLLLLAAFNPTIVLEADMETGVCFEVGQVNPPVHLGRYRGSTPPIPFGNGYLGIAHDIAIVGDQRGYLHRFVELDRDLAITRVSHLFTFQQAGHETAGGLCLTHDGSTVLIAWSSAGGEMWISGVPVEDVEQLLLPVADPTPTISGIVGARSSP